MKEKRIKKSGGKRVRWADKRQVAEEGLERFEDYLQEYSRNRNHPFKILCSFYKGHQWQMVQACLFLVVQRSPVWVIPIATANTVIDGIRVSFLSGVMDTKIPPMTAKNNSGTA